MTPEQRDWIAAHHDAEAKLHRAMVITLARAIRDGVDRFGCHLDANEIEQANVELARATRAMDAHVAAAVEVRAA